MQANVQRDTSFGDIYVRACEKMPFLLPSRLRAAESLLTLFSGQMSFIILGILTLIYVCHKLLEMVVVMDGATGGRSSRYYEKYFLPEISCR